MSCDISESEGEIKGVEMAIEKRNQETARLHEMVADMEKIKADCLAKAAKPAAKPAINSVAARSAAWALANPGPAPKVATHRSGYSGNKKRTANDAAYLGTSGGRRTRRSKTRSKTRSKMRR